MTDDVHPALLAALAQGGGSRQTEGVVVRRACGFAPALPYLAEVTQVTPVGPVIVTGHGETAEEAVDAARAQIEPRSIEIAPTDIREELRNPRKRDEIREAFRSLFGDLDTPLLALTEGGGDE